MKLHTENRLNCLPLFAEIYLIYRKANQCLKEQIKYNCKKKKSIAFRCAAKNRNDVMFAKHNGNDVRTNINKDGHDKQ